jgi:glycosyltransferase involved in cell wall biosynthesis
MARKLKLNGRIVFLGQLKQARAAEFIAAADLCLVYYKMMPVNLYRASMKLREYLAMGKNITATAVGEIRQFKNYVFLSRPDRVSFSAAINKAMNSVEKRGKKGYILINEKYDWKTEMKKFYSFLSENTGEKFEA